MGLFLKQVSSDSSSSSRVYLVSDYGGDPRGEVDSTEALLAAMADAVKKVGEAASEGSLIQGIANLGGPQIYLQGGSYLISRPLQFPVTGVGNLVVFSIYLLFFKVFNFFL